MRAVRAEGEGVVRLGRARATRYARPEVWQGLSHAAFPVFRVNESGQAVAAGELVTLAASETLWRPHDVVQRGLPPEMDDAVPGGLLSAQLARTHPDWRIPTDRAAWTAGQALTVLTRRGEDLPGNLIVGHESLSRWQAIRPAPRTRSDLSALADATIGGSSTSPLVGGRRPKFAALVDGRHVIVTAVPGAAASDPVATRCRDLLYLEERVLRVIADRGVPCAAASLVEAGSYVCLEVVRLDRVGVRGRRAVQRLSALHLAPADSWADAGASLRDGGRLPEEDARRLRWLDAFGACIGEPDRPLRRVLLEAGTGEARLVGVSGLRPGLFVPSSTGHVPQRSFEPPVLDRAVRDVSHDARAAAVDFWVGASEDARLSDGMRALCGSAARQLA